MPVMSSYFVEKILENYLSRFRFHSTNKLQGNSRFDRETLTTSSPDYQIDLFNKQAFKVRLSELKNRPSAFIDVCPWKRVFQSTWASIMSSMSNDLLTVQLEDPFSCQHTYERVGEGEKSANSCFHCLITNHLVSWGDLPVVHRMSLFVHGDFLSLSLLFVCPVAATVWYSFSDWSLGENRFHSFSYLLVDRQQMKRSIEFVPT